MFASKVTREVTLPGDASVTVKIRKLSWLQRQDARKQSQQQSSRDLVAMGGAEFLKVIHEMEKPKALTAAGDAEPAAVDVAAVVPVDPIDRALAQHDMLTVLVGGIASWTAPEPPTKATISDLDEADAEFLAREILALSLPPASLEADRKNDA